MHAHVPHFRFLFLRNATRSQSGLNPAGPFQENIHAVFLDPFVCCVPVSAKVYSEDYRDLIQPNLIRIHASPRLPECVYIVVGLKHCPVVHDERHAVHIIEHKVGMEIGIIGLQIWRHCTLHCLNERCATRASECPCQGALASSACTADH